MDTHTFFLIMRNEMKLQMRSWVFRFFIVLSLVGIVAYQMYIHGAGSSAWKMVALPCSMPLMNAYLFSVVQSLFLIVIMSEFPQRLIRSGLRDGVMVRPFSNTVLLGGIDGNIPSFPFGECGGGICGNSISEFSQCCSVIIVALFLLYSDFKCPLFFLCVRLSCVSWCCFFARVRSFCQFSMVCFRCVLVALYFAWNI